MLTIHTSRINYTGPGRLDITVKSATEQGRIFAPTWELVGGHKHFHNPEDARWQNHPPLSNEQYTGQYYNLIRNRYRQNPKPFIELTQSDLIVLCCYCAKGAFCHRHFAADILLKIAQSKNITATIQGEID